MLAGALSNVETRRRNSGRALQGGRGSAGVRAAAVGAGPVSWLLRSSLFYHDVRSASSLRSSSVSDISRDQSPPCARSSRRREHVAVPQPCQCLAPSAARFREDLAKRFYRSRDGRHLRRLQGRRLSDHRQRQGSLRRGQAAGLDLQDPEFADRAGDRRGRGSRQGRVQMGRGEARHRGLEQGSHLALARSPLPPCRSIRRSPGASGRSGCRNMSTCSNTATAISAAASTSSG